MPEYRVTVIDTEKYRRVYEVEAPDEADARENYDTGDSEVDFEYLETVRTEIKSVERLDVPKGLEALLEEYTKSDDRDEAVVGLRVVNVLSGYHGTAEDRERLVRSCLNSLRAAVQEFEDKLNEGGTTDVGPS